jgi:hypothetical protein
MLRRQGAINVITMADRDDDDAQAFVLYTAQDSIGADPVAPKSLELSVERLAVTPRVPGDAGREKSVEPFTYVAFEGRHLPLCNRIELNPEA